VNASSLTRLYHTLMRATTLPISANLWSDLLEDCQRNNRVHELVLTLLRPYTP
jgi:hypothetical protein